MMKMANWLSKLLLLIPILSFSKTRIAILDTGIRSGFENYYCDASLNKDFTGYGIHDYHGHGTNIAWLVTNGINVAEACIVVIKWFDNIVSDPKDYSTRAKQINDYIKALTYAVTILKPDIVNLSLDGPNYILEEHTLLEQALNKKMRVVVAAGNSSLNLDMNCVSFPACLDFKSDNFYVVGSINNSGIRLRSSNYGKVVKYWQFGHNQGNTRVGLLTGTSQAAANFTNSLIKRKAK